MEDHSVIKPGGDTKRHLPACGILAVNPTDTLAFSALAGEFALKKRSLFNAQLFSGSDFFLAGPAVGAPMAAICLEMLIARGASRVLLYSWCGSLNESLRIGDFFLPLAVQSEEGASRHYPYSEAQRDTSLEKSFQAWLVKKGVGLKRGTLWTTDAPFRETREKVTAYAQQGVWAVDMEYAALKAVAAFHKVKLAAIFTVSDELSGPIWRRAFSSKAFCEDSRKRLQELCHFWNSEAI